MFIQLLRRFMREQVMHRVQQASVRIALLVGAVLLYSTTGYMFFEIAKKPETKWVDALWWSVVTMTTVGYGDMFPESLGGRIFVAIPTMIIGIGLLGFVLSVVATALIEARANEMRGNGRIRVKKHIVICNYPNRHRVQDLVEQIRADESTTSTGIVLVDPELEELPIELARRGVQFVRGNPAKGEVLRRARIEQAQGALVLARNQLDEMSDHTTLAILLTIEDINSAVFTVAELVDNNNRELLRRTGCDAIVCLAGFTTNFMVQELLDPGVQSVLDQLTSTDYGQQMFLVDFEATEAKPIRELHVWAQGERALLLGFQRDGETTVNPSMDVEARPGDKLVLIAQRRPKPYR